MQKRPSVFVPAPSGQAVAFLAAVVVLFSISYAVTVTSPGWREREKAELAAQIGYENRLFCEGLGFSTGSPEYARCEQGADLIREKQSERSQLEWNLR